MNRFIVYVISLTLFCWTVFWITVSEISLNIDDAKNVSFAAFYLEKLLDENSRKRSEMIETVKQFWVRRWLQDDPKYISLLSILDFKNRWVVLTMHDDTYWFRKQYAWWVELFALLQEDTTWNSFACENNNLLVNTVEECNQVQALRISDIHLVWPSRIMNDDELFFYFNDYAYFWCIESDGKNRLQTRRHIWDSSFVDHARSGNYDLTSQKKWYIAQILPFIEWNYWSHGPAWFACQSAFHRLQRM